MKEIIYLDTDIMNSMLAQLDEGLVNSFSLEQSTQSNESETTHSDRGKKAGLTAGVKVDTGALPGGGLHLRGTLGASGNESESYSRGILEGQKDILNKAFHDHALEVLFNKLAEKDLLIDEGNLEEGSIHLGNSNYRFYDFDLIKSSMNYETLKKFMLFEVNQSGLSFEKAEKIVNKKNRNARDRELLPLANKVYEINEEIEPILEIIKMMNSFSGFASSLLKDLTIIKLDDKIGLMKKKYLRESVESIAFRTDQSRPLKFLVRIIGKKEEVYNGEDLKDFSVHELNLIPNMMLDILLGSFDILQKGDLLVTPIACYYE